MKWVPLTDATLTELMQTGYTHLVVKSVTGKEQIQTDKEFVTLEAVKGKEPECAETYEITSEMTDRFVHSIQADYYVLYK